MGREAGDRDKSVENRGGGKGGDTQKRPQAQAQVHNLHSPTQTKTQILNQVNKTILSTLLLFDKYWFIIILSIF